MICQQIISHSFKRGFKNLKGFETIAHTGTKSGDEVIAAHIW
jgi:hypothetical protein